MFDSFKKINPAKLVIKNQGGALLLLYPIEKPEKAVYIKGRFSIGEKFPEDKVSGWRFFTRRDSEFASYHQPQWRKFKVYAILVGTYQLPKNYRTLKAVVDEISNSLSYMIHGKARVK